MKNLNGQIEELSDLSKVIAADSSKDVDDYTEMISNFFWRFNLKSYAYFEELFKEFAAVSKLLEALLLLDKVSEIIKQDQHINRYLLLFELLEITEDTYCSKTVFNPIVKRLSGIIKQPERASSTINQLLEIFEINDHENLKATQEEEEIFDESSLLKKLHDSENQVKELSEELEEINAQNSRLETEEANFNGTIKHLHKQIRWLEQSVLEEAVKVYQKNKALKRELKSQHDKFRLARKKSSAQESEIDRLKKELKGKTDRINTLTNENRLLEQQIHTPKRQSFVVDVKSACEVLDINDSNPTVGTVKKKYKELTQKWHPDLHIKHFTRYQLATEIFKEINEAKDYLCSPH